MRFHVMVSQHAQPGTGSGPDVSLQLEYIEFWQYCIPIWQNKPLCLPLLFTCLLPVEAVHNDCFVTMWV
jgi:hypothetical protein